MNRYKFKDGRQLRCGYTTGTCAAAAAKAAADILLSSTIFDHLKLPLSDTAVSLPDGTEVEIPIEGAEIEYTDGKIFFENRGGSFESLNFPTESTEPVESSELSGPTGPSELSESTESTEPPEISGPTGPSESTGQTGATEPKKGLKTALENSSSGKPRRKMLSAACSVRKDAGDDADVTDGLLICARVRISPESRAENRRKAEADRKNEKIGADEREPSEYAAWRNGKSAGSSPVQIEGGIGVGRVTKPGLDRAVGEAAINTVPRRMIAEAVMQVCERVGFENDIFVEIFVPNGEEVAAKTFNPILGIEGGISILGTSGIVEPMSDAAIAETIRSEIRVKSAELRVRIRRSDSSEESRGICLAAVPGNYGMKFACDKLHLREAQIVKCSNFIGDTLDAAYEYGLSGILLIGNAGKLIKLSAGIMNTHSSQADGRIETIIACSLEAGASLELLKRVSGCITAEAAFSVLKEAGLAQSVLNIAAERAAAYAERRVRKGIKTGVVLFTSESSLVSYGGSASEILSELSSEFEVFSAENRLK